MRYAFIFPVLFPTKSTTRFPMSIFSVAVGSNFKVDLEHKIDAILNNKTSDCPKLIFIIFRCE